MAEKIKSLTKKKEFEAVFKKGAACNNYLCSVKTLKNDSKEKRLGIIISNKISKKATERNAARRRIREIFRLKGERIKDGNDFVVMARPAIIKSRYEEIEAAVYACLKKLRMIK